MVKKNSNKKNSAADDLISSLLEDVENFEVSSEEDSELEATVYETPGENKKSNKKPLLPEDIANEDLMPNFDMEKGDTAAYAGDDFWEQAEKIAGKDIGFAELNASDEFKNLDKKEKPVYQGPEASSDFLDQLNAHLSPMHKSGVVNTKSDSGASNRSGSQSPSSSAYSDNSVSQYQGSVPEIKGSVVKSLNQVTELAKEIKNEKAEFNDRTVPLAAVAHEMDIPHMLSQAAAAAIGGGGDADRTVAVAQFAQKQNKMKSQAEQPESTRPVASQVEPDLNLDERIMLVTQKPAKGNFSQVSIDASLAQAENLRMAQNRILELEKEIERLRQENDEILTASDILRTKSEEYTYRISELEKDASESKADFKNELAVAKGNLLYKENENQKLKMKVEELEVRIKTDFKKIRIRERELENRLELLKAEKQAVVKSKDELLLELQRKNDQAKAEIDNYREKVQELNKNLENTQSQIKLTVRALRIALTHIEDKSDTPTPIKKAN